MLAKAGGGGTVVADARMIARAVKDRWPIDETRRALIVTVLTQIAQTDSYEIERVENRSGGNGEGFGPSETTGKIVQPNHRNQVAAARTLAAMVGQNQADEHHADKQGNDDARLKLDAVKALAGLSQDEKLALIQRAGLGAMLPVKDAGGTT